MAGMKAQDYAARGRDFHRTRDAWTGGHGKSEMDSARRRSYNRALPMQTVLTPSRAGALRQQPSSQQWHRLAPLAAFLVSISAGVSAAQTAPAPSAAPPAPAAEQKPLDLSRHRRLAEAAAIAEQWGYQAFAETPREAVLAKFTSPPPGKLTWTALIEDRCAIDPEGKETSQPGTYVTLEYHSEYASGPRRETVVLHEPAKDGSGLKIIALRRQVIPRQAQAIFDLAADIGQLALLRLHGAPATRTGPLQRRAQALAAVLKVSLPVMPEPAQEGDEAFGQKLVNLIMQETPALLAKVPRPATAPPSFDSALSAAKAVLQASAIMLQYRPGDETSSQLAVLTLADAEKAKIPRTILQPFVERIHRKAAPAELHESILTMTADISRLLEDADNAFEAARAPSEILLLAFKTMSRVPSYHANATFRAADGRESKMDAILAPGAVDIVLTGFDGKKQQHVASKSGFFVSVDGGKTWTPEKQQDTAEGLCRTIQSPVDPKNSAITSTAFQFAGLADVEGEQLFRFVSADGEEKKDPSHEYWVLLSKEGPVIRQARLPVKFGELATSAFFRYTQLGKQIEVVSPAPPKAPATPAAGSK
jgi:hypothetical protein